MAEQITTVELAKAAHNLKRLAEFVGVRRRWTLADSGKSPAAAARGATQAIAEKILEMTGGEIAPQRNVDLPLALSTTEEVSSARLAKFASYLEQLRRWFDAHGNTDLPVEAAADLRSIQRSLATTNEALRLMLQFEPEPIKETPAEPEALIRADLGSVAEVDTDARLILDHTWQKPLLENRGGRLELSADTVEKLDDFFADQSIELNSHDRRRLHKKVQRWIESTPNKRVLVLRMSGLFGKPDVVSSFQPREKVDDLPEVPAPVFKNPANQALGDETPVVTPRLIAPPMIETPEELAVEPPAIETPKKKSLLEEYLENPPSGVIPPTIAPPVIEDRKKKPEAPNDPADEE